MKRFLATLRTDFLIQYRNGFYLVGILTTAGIVALAGVLPESLNLDLILPLFIIQQAIVTTFYFAGALLLLEKSESVMHGLSVTPLKPAEYLGGKVVSLAILTLLDTLPIMLALRGFDFNWIAFSGGILFLCILFTLLGIAISMRYQAINEYLLPSIGVIIVLVLPYLDHLGIFASNVFWLHPLQPILVLFRASLQPTPFLEIVYAVLAAVSWSGAVLYLALFRFKQQKGR